MAERVLSEKTVDGMVAAADEANEFMLNGVQWTGDPEDLNSHNVWLAYEKIKADRKEMTRLIGTLAGSVLVLASRVPTKE